MKYWTPSSLELLLDSLYLRFTTSQKPTTWTIEYFVGCSKAIPSIKEKINRAILTFSIYNKQYKTCSICFIINFFIIKDFSKPPEYQANVIQKKKNRAANDKTNNSKWCSNIGNRNVDQNEHLLIQHYLSAHVLLYLNHLPPRFQGVLPKTILTWGCCNKIRLMRCYTKLKEKAVSYIKCLI